MAALTQIKAAEVCRLRNELENILCVLSENMSLLNNSILNGSNRRKKDSERVEIEEEERRLKHIQTYATCKSMLSRIEELVKQREELRKNANTPLILSRATLDGLKSKRDFLENRLETLKSREEYLESLKQQVRKAAHFSTDFERRFMEKKSQLACAKTYLNSLSSDTSSLKLSALGRFGSALDSMNRLSALLNELQTQSGGQSINLGAYAALEICRLAHIPRLGSRDPPYLYKEICKRFNSDPFVTPVEKVLERIHQIIVDGDSIDLVNNELDAALGSMMELRNVLRPSLEKSRVEEKDVCGMMATALKKVAFHCAKVSEKQKRLEELWKYWSEGFNNSINVEEFSTFINANPDPLAESDLPKLIESPNGVEGSAQEQQEEDILKQF
ncbi:hypothetical protein EGR_02337 [Echinococcus granulosus]|uniref:Uncharacterized protein n=1 Tax=Echinococcus granulosus TaxID=6210 RepID=W6UQ23_ECHGR|nr:hypothetical protein EGR_02337 [Echinococcus granulosus]EUB62896.1 hypothetical protein EGR_02337 [Echinococcus granulosus]